MPYYQLLDVLRQFRRGYCWDLLVLPKTCTLSTMDLKKLAFPDQFFPYCTTTSSRRKVASGFGLGLVASLFILSVVFLNVSFKASLLNPVFQGFNVYFSRATTFSCNASHCNGSVDNKLDYFLPLNGTLEGNVTNNSESMKFYDSGRKGEILEAAHLGNLPEEVKKENLALESEAGIDEDKLHGVRGSQVDDNGNFTEVGNVSKSVGNQNFAAEEILVEAETQVLKAKEQFPLENAVPANLTNTGDNSGSTGKENKSSEMSNGSSSIESNAVISSGYGFEILASANGFRGDCDIFDGRWVRDESKPYYPPGSCPYIDRDFDCHVNKRPDDEYIKWKWKPYNCDIPSLNASDFLERLRDQKLVFVGDSLNRNMWESLVCILRHSIPDKNRVYEISGRTAFKKKGFYAFRFEDYNCSVDFVSSPFLVRESSFNGKNGTFETLRLDLMDKTTTMYHDADVLIFNTGHWWTHEKTSKGEDYYQEGNHVHKRLKALEAYKRALGTWARWVDGNINGQRTRVIFRGYSVTHFRGGPWNSGGQCHKESEPIFNETYLAKYPSKMRALENVLHQIRTPVEYLNISRLTDFRKDGHPSIYRKEYKTAEEQLAGVHAQDCSHWCLPGVPDTWNELLYASLLKTGRGPWRN